MRLIIQIPCYNEEKTLPLVLRDIPKKIEGVKEIEVVVIDDGSKDKTVEVAKKYGCTVLKNKNNKGLGLSFKRGLEYALEKKADILVNTDGDNQYPSKYIPSLIKPVKENKADLVIGNRQPWKIKHFSPLKRMLQHLGSSVVRRLTNTSVEDTVSGFRAYSKEAMQNLNVTTRFSYVLDTLMQLSKKELNIVTIPIKTNKPTRKSRLFKNMFQHIIISATNVLRLYAVYEPFKTFFKISILFLIPGLFIGFRFLYFFMQGQGDGQVQSLIATAILIITSVVMFVMGILGELLKTNRQILEENQVMLRKIRSKQ